MRLKCCSVLSGALATYPCPNSHPAHITPLPSTTSHTGPMQRGQRRVSWRQLRQAAQGQGQAAAQAAAVKRRVGAGAQGSVCALKSSVGSVWEVQLEGSGWPLVH